MGTLAQVNLSVNVGSLHFTNPLIIVSGVFGYGEEFQKLSGFDPEESGAVVLKGVSLEPWSGNPPPRIVETAAGMLNAIGLQNIGVNKLVHEKLPLWENKRTNVIINVVGHSPEEYVAVSKIAAASATVAALELNLSCPNVSQGGLAFGTDPEQVKAITANVKEAVPDKPVWVKLTPNVDDIASIACAAVDGGAEAVSLINTVRGMAIDVWTRKPILANNIGGLSGPAIKPVALLKVAEVYRSFQEQGISIPIVGLGGVLNGTDVLEFMIAGAAAVGIGTTLFYDPLSVRRITQEIVRAMQPQFPDAGPDTVLQLSKLIGSLTWN